jgi:Fic family protein
MYNWQKKEWPNFAYNLHGLENELILFSEKTGHISGVFKALPEPTQVEAIIDTLVAEAVKTSEIEGEYVSRRDVLSSIRKNLGIVTAPEFNSDRMAVGVGELMIDVRKSFAEALSAEKLFEWHRMLLPGSKTINVGTWRSHHEPMQVVSGSIGKEKIHFEAPPSHRVPEEMQQFLDWFNETAPGGKKHIRHAPVRAAIAHLYFETIHPFEDGNGRIGRALAEKALSQGIGRPVLISLSRTIEANRKAYYDALQKGQTSNEITNWLHYFVKTIVLAQAESERQIEFTLKKVKYFDLFKTQFSERQLKVIKRMLEEGPQGFEGGINASKYGSITRVSKATATRDLQQLLQMGAITYFGEGGGRSTSYEVRI